MKKKRRQKRWEIRYGSHGYGHEREIVGGVVGEDRKRDKRGERKIK